MCLIVCENTWLFAHSHLALAMLSSAVFVLFFVWNISASSGYLVCTLQPVR